MSITSLSSTLLNTKRIQFGPQPARWSFPDAVLAVGDGCDEVLKSFARLDVGTIALSRDGGDLSKQQPVSIIIMRGALEYAGNPHALLSAVRTALLPAGLFACEVLNADAAGYSKSAGRLQSFNLASLRDVLTRAGFAPRESFFGGRKVTPFGKPERQFETVGFYATPMAAH